MEKFGDYMYYLLSFPFQLVKRPMNQWYIYLQVLGKLFDKNKESFLLSRSEGCVATASPAMLQEYGLDRHLIRYAGEDQETFRKRILTYDETCRLGGTDRGVRLAMEALGIQNFELIPCYKIDGNQERWAEFYVTLYMDMETGEYLCVPMDVLKNVVRQVKKVSARPTYLTELTSKAKCSIRGETALMCISLCYPHPNEALLLLDGSWYLNGEKELSDYAEIDKELYPSVLNGSWSLNGDVALTGSQLDDYLDIYPLVTQSITSVDNEINASNHLVMEKDLWHLNGWDLLDGSRSLAANIYTYDM